MHIVFNVTRHWAMGAWGGNGPWLYTPEAAARVAATVSRLCPQCHYETRPATAEELAKGRRLGLTVFNV